MIPPRVGGKGGVNRRSRSFLDRRVGEIFMASSFPTRDTGAGAAVLPRFAGPGARVASLTTSAPRAPVSGGTTGGSRHTGLALSEAARWTSGPLPTRPAPARPRAVRRGACSSPSGRWPRAAQPLPVPSLRPPIMATYLWSHRKVDPTALPAAVGPAIASGTRRTPDTPFSSGCWQNCPAPIDRPL